MPRDIVQELGLKIRDNNTQNSMPPGNPRDIVQELGLKMPSPLSEEDRIRQQHPILSRVVDVTSKIPGLSQGIEYLSQKTAPLRKGIEASGLPALAGGALQGGADMGVSLANLPLDALSGATGKNFNIPHLDLEQYNKPGLVNDLMFGAGRLGTEMAGGLGMYSKLGRLIPRPGGYKGLGIDALKGALSGYALGENEQGDRWLPALLGGAAAPLSSLTSKSVEIDCKSAMFLIFALDS